MRIVLAAASVLACTGGGQGSEAGHETSACVDGECLGGLACVDDRCVVPDGEADTDAESGEPQTSSSTGDTNTSSATTSEGTTSTSTTGGPIACPGGGCAVDVLVVVDNSGTMATAQRRLAGAMALLEPTLRELDLDVQLMFTTTDFGNMLCTPFEPPGYSPARGTPIATACTQRLDDFTGLGGDPEITPETCTELCPDGIAPDADPFIAFYGGDDNVPDAPPQDIDGDGVDESAAAQAMACVAPMGINGCGYESPLENMLQALAPTGEWNQGPRPFLRDGAVLAIVIATDEADCSILDASVMQDEAFQEIDPDTGMPGPTSAICWNAGVSCNGPDGMGVYSDCEPSARDGLQPIARYTDYLVGVLRGEQGKEVVMMGLVGVPPVTARADAVPYTPTEGGVFELVYRDWRDGEFPAGDIVPPEFAAGVTAADKEFSYGIGPGCTTGSAASGYSQAIPPTRVRAVCESLNLSNDASDQRCCLESVCDADYSGAMTCLSGLIQNAI